MDDDNDLLDAMYGHGDFTFSSHIAQEESTQYIFVLSGAHAQLYSTLTTCSYSIGEAIALEEAAANFADEIYQKTGIDCRCDNTWQHLALLAKNEQHVEQITERLKANGFQVIDDVIVLWPQQQSPDEGIETLS